MIFYGGSMSKTVLNSLFAVLLLVPFNLLWGQWPTDPATNLSVSNMSGEETISHITPISDGGCYVSWWNNTSGTYWFYLQRYDANGVAQWADNGILISNHAQDTWLTDYTLTTDSADYAIITINDLRAGGDWDIYGYRISPAGDFAWGANGLTVSSNTAADYDPQVIVTSGGNIVFTWQDENSDVHLRKFNPEGTELWPEITLSSTYGLSIPRLATAEDDGFILQMLVKQGPGNYDPKHLYAHKYDSNGTDLWGSSGVAVTTAGGFGLQMRPAITSDGADGAYSYWYDSRGNVLHAYAQHILDDGAMAWTANGVVVSTTSGHLQMNPALVAFPSSGDVMLFYENTNSDQTSRGLYGQMIDSAGARQWGAGGIAFVSMAPESKMLVVANRVENDAVVTYLENPVGDFAHELLKGIRVDHLGSQVWETSPVTMASAISEKGYNDACSNINNQVIAVWQDKRIDSDGDIYLQNINADGALGPGVAPLTNFNLILPANGAVLDSCYPHFYWQSSVDPAPGYPVKYMVYVDSILDFSSPFIVSDTLQDTLWDCPVCLVNDPDYFWRVKAFSGHAPDRMCDSTFVFTVEAPNAGCAYIPGDINGNGSANGIDVTFAVTYLKGGSAPPVDCGNPVGPCSQISPFYPAGDVNGSCSFNGIDITFYVAFLKGLQPELVFCPTCPPAQ
jgi:hypothetical protein